VLIFCSGGLAMQKNIFFYHFEEFDLNNLIQPKHWNCMP
jgi:hypothetical protein